MADLQGLALDQTDVLYVDSYESDDMVSANLLRFK